MDKICALCNEGFEQIDFEVGDVWVLDDEYWHPDCYAEYFGEVLEEV